MIFCILTYLSIDGFDPAFRLLIGYSRIQAPASRYGVLITNYELRIAAEADRILVSKLRCSCVI